VSVEPTTRIICHESWRAEIWDDDTPSRPGWQVECAECGLLKPDWAYASPGSAHSVATRHRQRWHGAPTKAERRDREYDAGVHDGTTSLAEEIRYQFSGEPGTAQNLDELLEFFRMITGDPELEWPG
jgi:hypothetical protein